MPGLNLAWTLGLGIPALVVQTISVVFARALRTYSRSRLEEVCEVRGRPELVDEIDRNDVWTERSAEALSLLSSLILAALVGAHMVSRPSDRTVEITGVVILVLAVLDQVIAGAIGRVWAETLLATAWPIAVMIRFLAAPLTAVTVAAEWVATRFAGPAETPRPASVEVEIPADADHPEDDEADVPDSTREMLERVVEITRLDVSEIMTTRPSFIELSAETSALEAARVFRQSGFSRIPLFGESRDDIVGVLYAKDLLPAIIEATDPAAVSPRKLARPPYFVPETKNVSDLLEEFRSQRLHVAIVVDEYGAVVGLATLEDLIEQLIGPISDEHDQIGSGDPVKILGKTTFEVDAAVSLEELNERLKLSLPTNGDVETVGGFAFHALGRLPEAGASFRSNGVAFTVVEVGDHKIRRVQLEVGAE